MRVIRLTRRQLLPVLPAALAALAVILFFTLPKSDTGSIQAEGSAGCAAYLEKLGWQADPEPIETLRLRLPEDLTAEYGDYIALQRAQNLPFADCGGQAVCRYTFRLTNYPGGRTDAQANIYLCGRTVIAGDVMLLGEGGGRQTLDYPG